MDFGRLDQRNVLIVGAVLLLLVLVGFYVFILGPLRQELAQRQDERDAKQAQLSQLEAEISRLEGIQSRAPEVQRQLLQLSRRVPAQPEIPTLVSQVQEIAESAGVTQLLIQPEDPEEPEDGGDYAIIPVTMTFEGDYGELQNFLVRLRSLTRLVAVESVTYENVEDEQADQSGDPTLQIELRAQVYAQPGEAGIQTNAAPQDTGGSDSTGGESTSAQ